MGFSRQEYWSGYPLPPPRDLLDPGIKHGSPALQADSLPPEPSGKPTECILLILTGKGASLQGRLFLPPILISVNSLLSVSHFEAKGGEKTRGILIKDLTHVIFFGGECLCVGKKKKIAHVSFLSHFQ